MNDIKILLQDMGNFLGIPVIRKNQTGSKPAYPFCSYGITSIVSGEYFMQRQIENLNPTKITELNEKQIRATISLAILDNKGIADIAILSEQAFQFLELETINFQKEKSLTIRLDENLLDRTIYLDPVYEYAFGFDFFVYGKIQINRVIDAIDLDLSIQEMIVQEI